MIIQQDRPDTILFSPTSLINLPLHLRNTRLPKEYAFIYIYCRRKNPCMLTLFLKNIGNPKDLGEKA